MSRSPLTERWSGRPDSNRRRPAWEAGGALPRFSPPILFAHFPKSCSNLSTTVCGLLLWLRQNERQKVGRIALSKDTARTLEVFEVLTTRYPQSRRELLSSLCPAICPSGKPVVASRPSIGHGEQASSVSVKDTSVRQTSDADRGRREASPRVPEAAPASLPAHPGGNQARRLPRSARPRSRRSAIQVAGPLREEFHARLLCALPQRTPQDRAATAVPVGSAGCI